MLPQEEWRRRGWSPAWIRMCSRVRWHRCRAHNLPPTHVQVMYVWSSARQVGAEDDRRLAGCEHEARGRAACPGPGPA